MTVCPGCGNKLGETMGMAGFWFAPDGTHQVYSLCRGCTALLAAGNSAVQEGIMENVEAGLTLAGDSPSRAAH